MSAPGPAHENPPPRGLALVRRVRGPRAVGVALCALCVLPSIPLSPIPPLYWALTGFFVLVWPQLAYLWAHRTADPLRAERINLWLDAAYVGCIAGAIDFALVPTASLLMATSLSIVTVGGLRFLLLGFTGHAVGIVLGGLIWGWDFQPHSSPEALMATMPLLFVYPLLMGSLMYRLASKLKESRRELRFLSEHDALSGVHNRRFFDQTLRQVFSQFQRNERSLSLLVGDVDDFKRINDRQGHAAGDGVIRRFGEALTQCARGGDVVARLGGDEFVVLLVDANAEQAFHYARRVQARMGEVSVSFGVAMARRSMKTHEQWLEQADKALYRSKALDRGGVSLAGADGAPPTAAG